MPDDLARLAASVESLLEWRREVDREIQVARAVREKYVPILDAMTEAQKIADAIKEHNHLQRELADAKEARAFSHGQVYVMVAALLIGSIGVPLVLHFVA